MTGKLQTTIEEADEAFEIVTHSNRQRRKVTLVLHRLIARRVRQDLRRRAVLINEFVGPIRSCSCLHHGDQSAMRSAMA